MSQDTRLQVELITWGNAPEKLDISELEKDIRFYLADPAAGEKPAPVIEEYREGAPEGTMGADLLIGWAIDVLSDPAMYPYYIAAFYRLNQALISRGLKPRENPKDEPDKDTPAVIVKREGKKISLPLSVSVLKKVVEEFFENG
ncbi:hypothetical protein [uncultured Tateyamaria sp.]|uniref:hypothetical protein n=1 Tax=uncultured Tateyamaria sp. TaxID=455651 RepID=UPI00260E2891|nr:hypothetical protein [uncultured Tateyamaria sp.]